jgi:glycosyltransferase involved in cell wall biosynthesis
VKLIVQIPCFNEADTLPITLADLPQELEGFDTLETLVIDDGSDDGTAQIAREMGVDHVVRVPRNRGLANAFALGLRTALGLGADVIVNTDGDNQYPGEEIENLVRPILDGEADMVVGDRQVSKIEHFSATKKLLQQAGSWVVRWASGTRVPDATSGFRALSREAALHLVVYSSYTYTLETIIQAGKKGLVVASVPIRSNPTLRESRLIRSTLRYVLSSAATIMRIFLMYEPLKVFLSLGAVLAVSGLALFVRFMYFYLIGQGQGHVQSLIAASVLVFLGFQTFLLGLLSDLIARNRRISEEISYQIRKSGAMAAAAAPASPDRNDQDRAAAPSSGRVRRSG